MTPKEEEEFKKQKILEQYEKLRWSGDEKAIQTRSKFRYPNLIKNRIPLSLALKVKLRKSCFGRFIKEFNEDQNQDYYKNINKIGLESWNIKNHNVKEANDWIYCHNYADELFELLQKAVETTECIDYDFIYNNLTGLRLTDCQINYVDSIKKFANLEVLILAGNWIKTIAGKKLPTKLEFLECFVNEISNVTKLCEECPKRIKHLGLGRNKLTNDSCFHLCATSGNFTELQTLDISNNDILNLTELLEQLRGLKRLIALNLEGNPCYTCEAYKDIVLETFPKLLYLDETELLPGDREIKNETDSETDVNASGLIFTCYRLIGIPTPPKGNVVHTFHLEIELHLMEEIKLPVVEKPIEIPKEEQEKPKKEKKGKGKGKDKGKNKKEEKSKKGKAGKSSKVKAPKPVKGKGLYALKDEYESEVKNKLENNNFKTEAREWNQVIKFNNPAVIVATPENNLQLLRDTFRSRVKVKIVYTQKIVNKKGKKGKKDKGKSGGGPKVPDEIILKKCTFATFYCDLHSVNWSDQYVDFIWADFPKLKDKAIPVEGSLKPEIYLEKGKGKGNKGNKEKSSKSSKSSKKKGGAPTKLPLPTKLTCHVGFGIKRLGQTQELVSFKKGKKKK